jgi:hypothetical protein
MEAFLKSLEQLKELQIVRFISQFFTEEQLSPIVNQYKQRVAGDPAGLARDLLLWAVLLALVTFAVDQAFYWTQPGRVAQARESWYAFTEGAGRAWDRTKDLARRVASGAGRNGELPRGRR